MKHKKRELNRGLILLIIFTAIIAAGIIFTFDYYSRKGVAGKAYGILLSPESISFSLSPGWNLISIPYGLENNAPESVFFDIIDDIEIIFSYDPEVGWEIWSPNAPSNMQQIEPGRGYWIKIKNPTTLEVQGIGITEIPSFKLKKGWNLIGIHISQPIKLEDYLPGLKESYVSLYYYDYNYRDIRKLMVDKNPTLEPGVGYWLYMKEDAEVSPGSACEEGCPSGHICKEGACVKTEGPEICKDDDNYCPWECNDWKLDSDCGIPEIYNFIESRNPTDYLNSNIIHWDDTSWRNYQPLIQKVNELTTGISDNFEKAKRIANWVKNSRPYGDPSPANQGKNVVEIFNSNTGVCMDAAILTAAMFRIANIPSRAILPGFHEYAEAYINGRWVGFDATFGNGDALIIDPVTSIVYNNEFYKNEPRYVSIFSDGTPRNLTNVSYYKVNVIPRTIYKNSYADISIIWNLSNTQKQVKENYCELSSLKTGQLERFDTSPILKNVNGDDNEYSLNCKVIFTAEPTTEYDELVAITFTGTKIETNSVTSSGYINITVKTNKIENNPAGWGYVYIPTTSITVFENNDNTYNLAYDKQKYLDFTQIRWVIKSDNLNCDYYHCFYVNSNNYSQHIFPTGILGYGTFVEFGTRGMPPEHYNGLSKISLPEGKYKIIYSFDGEVGYKFFDVLPNQEYIVYPSQLNKDTTATQNKFEVLKTVLISSTEGLIQTQEPVTPKCSNNLTFDEDSKICMEGIVFNQINDIYTKAKICEDCNSLPQPIISLNNGDKTSVWNLYLNGKKVRRFILPFPDVEKEIISNSNNVLIETNWIEVNGTNSIKFLIPSEGNYFQNRYDILIPNQDTNIRYMIVKKQGDYGSAYFFILEDDTTFDLDNTIQIFDNIAKDHSKLAGLENPDPYYVIAMPTVFAGLLGVEGNFYMGNHLTTVNYGGEKYYELYNRDILMNELAHEYIHGLQETFDLWGKYQAADFFMEGMADAVSIYNGYRTWGGIGPFEEGIEPGCSYLSNPHVPHTLGRCIFKHLDQKGYLTDDFFYKLFHPVDTYYLESCSWQNNEFVMDMELKRPECVNTLNRLLSYLTNQDMTSFMKEELLASI